MYTKKSQMELSRVLGQQFHFIWSPKFVLFAMKITRQRLMWEATCNTSMATTSTTVTCALITNTFLKILHSMSWRVIQEKRLPTVLSAKIQFSLAAMSRTLWITKESVIVKGGGGMQRKKGRKWVFSLLSQRLHVTFVARCWTTRIRSRPTWPGTTGMMHPFVLLNVNLRDVPRDFQGKVKWNCK